MMYYCLFSTGLFNEFDAVFLELTNIAVNSDASLCKCMHNSAGIIFSSFANSSQKAASSTSSMTMLSLAIKLFLLCAIQLAL